MMSCEKVVQGIWDYLNREMTSESLAEVQKHVDLCRSCFSRVEFEKMLMANLKEKTDHCCPDKLKAKIQKIIDLY